MPKSKRDRKSALTQVQKKTRVVKDALVAKIRESLASKARLFVFSVSAMKNESMKRVREQWPGSRFFMGKNKVMQLAIGKTAEDEQKAGVSKLAHHISGSRGLLATDKSEAEVKAFFEQFEEQHYARSGFTATTSYKLAAGTLPADRCPHPMEPMLRRLGLPTKLQMGKVELLNDVNVCKKGDQLTPEQCKILQLFGVKMATFRVHPLYMYAGGDVKEIGQEPAEDEDAAAEAEDEEAVELRTAGGEEFDPTAFAMEEEAAESKEPEMDE